jgi:hypothetical protein
MLQSSDALERITLLADRTLGRFGRSRKFSDITR